MKNEKKTETVFFSVKGQVVIPRRLHREFEIEEGTRALVWTEGDQIVIKPITIKHFKAIRGSYKTKKAL